tara:strand:+ start:5491 stop:17406 length:11916 start_codon:yes stop_codon:yes gene_type:complete
MAGKISKRAASATPDTRAIAPARARVRAGLLGSTALIAVGLACTPANAQTTIASPAGGGTITRVGGSSTTNDQTGAGGGILISNVTQAATTTVNGVTITNTTGSPQADALRIQGTASLASTGVSLIGVNTLTTTVNGGAALYVQTSANMGIGITSSGSTFTGSYGINLQAPSGYVSFDASNQSQSFVANGTHIAGFNSVTGVNAGIQLGSSTFTGFDTGINSSNYYGSYVQMTGGSINALVTGIRTDATGGRSNIESQAAIVAPTGIHSTNTAGAQITTSGAGTINSTSNGVGTGIIATSSGGTAADPFTINVGAAIGNITAFATGVNLSTTGSSANVINLTTTAAITATGRAIDVTAGVFGNTGTFNLGGNVTGATGVYTNVGNYAVNVAEGVVVTSTGNGTSNAALYLLNGTNTVTNNGVLTASGTGSHGVHFSSDGLVTNTATGTISGSSGIWYQNVASVSNAGTITGTGAANTAGVYGSSGASVTNTGTITGYDGVYSGGNPTTHNNSGTITGVAHGYNLNGGRITLTNSGTINTAGGTGGAGLSGLRLNTTLSPNTITNSGTITGGGDVTYGFGVEIVDGAVTLTNQSGGVISGGIGGIWLASDDLATLNLNLGSTVTGSIVSTNSGARTTILAGLLTGGYDASAGTGVDTFTLASTGSITGAVNLGGGDDVFNWQGGTIGSTINAGSGTGDVFNSALGAGNAGSLSLTNLSGFETYNHSTGELTLTGSRNGGAVWNIATGTTLNLAGSLTNVGGTGFAISAVSGSTVNVLAGGVLNNWLSVYFNGSATSTVTNSGSMIATSTGISSSNGRINVTNNAGGTITASTSGAISLAFGGGTIINNGTLTGGSDVQAGFGLLAQYTGATVTNNAGTISGGAGGILSGSTIYGGLLSVTNAAGAQISGPVAITTGGTSSLTLNNSGRVLGGTTGAIVANGSGAVAITNNAGGQIVSSGGNAVSTIGTATITNAGLIGNGTVSGGGVYTASGTNYAINIAGGTITNSGTITGGGAGIYSSNGLTLTNTGTITGGEGGGVLFRDGVAVLNAPSTILNAGTISAPVYSALLIQGGTITNAAAGSLTGGSDTAVGVAVQFSATGGAFTNYGSATGAGAGAVRVNTPGAATTINLHAGSTTGAILLNSGNDTLSIYSGRGTSSLATVDGASGITLQNAGTLGAAVFGTADLGGGTNTLSLRGTGDGTAVNGTAGTFNLSGGSVIGASILSKLDLGTWTLTGDGTGYTTINAGDGGSNDGLLILNGTGLAAGININGATVRAMNAAALGTGLITMINPTLQFASTDTYTNAISLAASSPSTDPTNLQTFGTGVVATLTGRISEANAGQPLVFSSVDSNGVASTGTFVLANAALNNSWTGATTITAGTTLRGTTSQISGGSIVNNGVLNHNQNFTGSVSQAISGSGSLLVDGGGYVSLFGTGTFTGGTTVNGSTLQIGDGATGGSITGAITLANNARATFVRTDNFNFISNISGSGDIRALGTITLSGAITTSGTILMDSGGVANVTLAGARSGANVTAVTMSGPSSTLNVSDTGSIQGGQFIAVRMTSGGSTLNNLGSITNAGTDGDGTIGASVYVSSASGVTTINNGSLTDTGAGSRIQGSNAGIRHQGGSDTLVVNNYGNVIGNLYNGIENSAGDLTVNNFSGGLIRGHFNAITGGGVINITNAGTLSNVNNGANGIDARGTLTLVNQNGGLITGGVFGHGVLSNGAGTSITNQSGGQISGSSGVTAIGAGNALALTNAGTITGTGIGVTSEGTLTLVNSGAIRQTTGGGAAVTLVNGGSILNSGGGLINGFDQGVRLVSGATTITNAGSITGGFNDAIYAGGALTLINTGALTSNSYSGVYIAAGGSITNAGTITGGSFAGQGYGVLVNTSVSTLITNQSGGMITGGVGSIQLSGAGSATIDLRAGSTTSGQILSIGSGARNLTIAGTLNGAYDAATGTGVDTVTLASTGSMTSALLGAGNDSFAFQGGSFSGTLDGGTGTDSFASTLGGAGVATLSLTSITGFETFAHNSGQLTLTGAGGFANGATVSGGTLLVNGTLSADTLVNSGVTLGGTGTINGALTIADGGILTGVQGGDLAIGSLNLSSGSIINATFSGAGGPALFAIGGNLTLDGTLNVASSGAYGFGVYGLMTYGGALTDNGLTLGTTPGGAQRVSVQTSVAGQINVVHAPTTLLFWDGGNGGQHDNGAVNGGTGVWTAAGSEWTDANGLFNGAMEPQPGFAIFQGTGGLITVDDVAGAVGVTGMQFAADGYSIQGDSITLAAATTTIRVGNGTLVGGTFTTLIGSELTGAGQLAQTDLGTLILTGDNTYTGGTSIDTGRLQIGAGGTTGSILGAVTLANGGTLTFARSDNHVFNNAVSGTGSVNINGVVTLTGPITNTFGVNVGAGSIATLSNVSLTSGNAVIMSGSNATVNVANGGVVQSLNGTGIFVFASNGFIDNLGTISGSNTAVYANADLTLTNGASGSISGPFAVSALQNLDLTNNGSINATVTNFNSSGIYAGATGTILNTGSITSGTNAIYTQGTGAVTNSGLIRGGGAASTIRLFAANSIVTNQAGGEINTSGTGTGVYLDGADSTVINAGTIRGGNAVNFAGVGGTLTNSGVLTGLNGSAVVGNGGVVTNLAGGSITGQLSGVTFVSAAGSATNAGTIVGTTAHGVNLNAGGVVDNSGSISGALVGVRSLAGLNLTSSGSISGGGNAVESLGVFNDTLTFLNGSTTTGSVLTDGGDDLISLAGLLTGSVSAGAGSDTVTLFGTGSFTGVLDGGDGVDSFILDGADAGTVDISTVLNFESRRMQGSSTFTLTGTDTSSVAWVIDSGVLNASGGLAIGDDVSVTIGANGTLGLMSTEVIGALEGSGLVNLGGYTLGVANGGAYAGVIDGSGGLTLLGGTLTLSGANTYSGLTDIQGGTLALGASDILSDETYLSIATGGTLDLGAFTDTVSGAEIAGALSGTGTLTASNYLVDGATVNANLGAGNLFVVGTGISSLNGMSGAGLVSIQAGTLVLGASNRLADTATVSVSSGATLNLNAFNDTVQLALLNGTLAGTGTLTAAEYQLNGATVNANLGTGNLFNTGGVSILNGTAATGQVVVQAGTLRLGTSERLADTANLSVASGATLDLQGHDETVALALLNGTLNSTVSVPDDAQVIPALGFSTKGTDGPLTIPAPSGTGTLTAAQYQLNGATINGNLGTGSLFNSGGVSTLNGTSAASSVVVQAGTLVLGASDRLADTATVSVSSGATLNLNAFNDTVQLALLNGTLAGTGTLGAVQYQLVGATVNANLGAGTLFTLGGVSTLTGSAAASQVNVNAGTLRLGASDRLADSALVSVSSGATFDVNSRTDTIGSLFGTGAVAISSGRLTLGGVSSAFGGSLSGSGSLVHTSGLFTLGGNHTLQSISNTGGELRFLAATSGNVAVSGGNLTGAGTIGGALTVSGGATLSPGLGGSNGLGTFAVGSLTLNGGTLALDVLGTAGGNLTDRLVVSGTANLTGGILAPTFQAPAGGYDFLTRYQFLTAGQRVGTFSNGGDFAAAAGQSTLFWRVRYDLAPNAAVLELRSLVDFTAGPAGSGNQNAVGQALTGGQLEASDDWAGVLSLLADLTPAQQQATFDSLGGEALADLSSSLLAANDAFAGAVREAGAARIPGANPLNFASAFSFVGGRDGAAAMVTSVLDAFDPSAGTGSAEGGWISVHASDVDLQGKQGQADLQTRLNAFVGGYAVGTGDFVLGAAAGASRMEGDVSGRQSSYESDLLHAAGYARYDNGRWAADLTASAYGGEIDSRRIVSVGAFTGQATGRTHGEGQSLSASVARRFVHEDGSAISVGLMQTLSRSTIDAFTETGAGGLSLEVADQERNWQTTQLNLRGTQDYQLSGQPLRMYGGLGVLITTGDREARSDMRFSGAAAGFGGFTVEGAGATPLAGTAELGFEYQPREGLTLSTGYRAVFSQRLNDNQIGARMSVQW